MTSTFIQGPPGTRYEVIASRRPGRATAWIGRVDERVEGGGCELWRCTHRHASEQEAYDCAVAEGSVIAGRALAEWQAVGGSMQSLASSVAGFFAGLGVDRIEWADDDGIVERTLDTATGVITDRSRS
jgi:hypothetical protein